MVRRVVVTHQGYACESDCCGHVVEVDGVEKFHFAHPNGGAAREFAERLVRESGCDPADLDWENCLVIDNC